MVYFKSLPKHVVYLFKSIIRIILVMDIMLLIFSVIVFKVLWQRRTLPESTIRIRSSLWFLYHRVVKLLSLNRRFRRSRDLGWVGSFIKVCLVVLCWFLWGFCFSAIFWNKYNYVSNYKVRRGSKLLMHSKHEWAYFLVFLFDMRLAEIRLVLKLWKAWNFRCCTNNNKAYV